MKKLSALILTLCLGLSLVGCNYNLIDLQYDFDKAIIQLPNGEIVEGTVEEWSDYEGDQLQVEIDNVLYLTHVNNVVLIKYKGE